MTPSHSHETPPIPIALDLSCLLDPPWTGVGYAAYHQVHALCELTEFPFDLRLFGVRSRRGPAYIRELAGAFSRECVLSYVRRLKPQIWTRLNWPPIEMFCGRVRLAHDFFHQLPAARDALRTATIHDLSFLRHPETHLPHTVREQTRLVRHAVNHADALIAVSEFCKRELIELLDARPERIHVVPNGVRLEDYTGPHDAAAFDAVRQRYEIETKYFYYLGTIEGRKNLSLLLEAYAAARARHNTFPQLVLAGKVGWRSEGVFDTLERLRLGSAVRQIGHVPRNDAIALLRGAVACVYPSIYEGFGLPALEAMAAGTPLLVSDADALREVVADTAHVLDRNDVDAWAIALEQVAHDPDRALALADRARTRAAQFTWRDSAHQLATTWLTLIGSDPR